MVGSRSHPAPDSRAMAALAAHQRVGAPTASSVGIGGTGRLIEPAESAGMSVGSRGRSEMATPLRLKSLHPERVAAIMAADPRLILPVGTCDRHASHLTIGCDTVLVDRLADDLSAEFAILRAPTV